MNQFEKWQDRSLDIKIAFNPLQFLEYIKCIIEQYHILHKEYPPFYLPYIILPFIVYKDFYETLPRAKSTKFTMWHYGIGENMANLYNSRYKSLFPYIQESLQIGVVLKHFTVSKDGKWTSNNSLNLDKKVQTKINILCSWFSPTGTKDILNTLGVKYEL